MDTAKWLLMSPVNVLLTGLVFWGIVFSVISGVVGLNPLGYVITAALSAIILAARRYRHNREVRR